MSAAQTGLPGLPGLSYDSAGPVDQAVKYGTAIVVGVVATVLVEKPVLRLRDRLVPTPARQEGDPPAREPVPYPAGRVPARVS